MPEYSPYYITDFAHRQTYLEVDGVQYELSHVGTRFALNEIPQAVCHVTIGRDVRSDDLMGLAAIQRKPIGHNMVKARVISFPRSPADAKQGRGYSWSGKELVLFDGYVIGVGKEKMLGKFVIVVNLIHWLVDLACSSMMSGSAHQLNVADLTAAAIMGTSSDQGIDVNVASGYVGSSVYEQTVPGFANMLALDWWSGIKTMFTVIASRNAGYAFKDGCEGIATFLTNNRAVAALSRMEGPLGPTTPGEQVQNTGKPYKYGKPLAFSVSGEVTGFGAALAAAIGAESVKANASMTFWDKLVGQYCPMFGISVVPMVDNAILVADTPMLTRTDKRTWADIYPEDYDNETAITPAERPLTGVVVVGVVGSTGSGTTATARQKMGGCYIAYDQTPSDGIMMTVGGPPWLDFVNSAPGAAATLLGANENVIDNSGLSKYYGAWAREVYTKNVLRGRTETISCPFRVDIAPGSIVRIVGSKDNTRSLRENSIDKMAYDLYGCVSAVSTTLNAEGPGAVTTFQLTHIRSLEEYNNIRKYGVPGHSLFGNAIHGDVHGAPLVSGAEQDTFYRS